jgi:hypothetical protein
MLVLKMLNLEIGQHGLHALFPVVVAQNKEQGHVIRQEVGARNVLRNLQIRTCIPKQSCVPIEIVTPTLQPLGANGLVAVPLAVWAVRQDPENVKMTEHLQLLAMIIAT